MTRKDDSIEPASWLPDNTSEDNESPAKEKPVERPLFRLVDAQWLRAQRSAIRGDQELADFQKKLADASVNFRNSQGHGVGTAIALTLGAVAVAAIAIVLGVLIMMLASEWLSSMGEG